MKQRTSWNVADLTGKVLPILSRHNRDTYQVALVEISGALGRPVSPDDLRKALSRHGFKAPSAYLGTEPTSERYVDLTTLAAASEQRLELNELRLLRRKVGDREYMTRRLESALIESFRRSPIRLSERRAKPQKTPSSRMITCMLSDIHFGLDVSRDEVPCNAFNWQIAARRIAKVVSQVADWKVEHRDETELIVVVNGDVIAGLIHTDDHGIRPLTEQIHGATHILVAALDYLAQFFGSLRCVFLPGNHDRLTRERQVAQRWDSHAHSVFLALAYAFRGQRNIKIEAPRTGEAVIELPGSDSVALYTHGDVQPTLRNVGRALDIKPAQALMNRINASQEYPKPVRILGFGHWHQGLVMPLGKGAVLVNGCVIGVDSFSRNGFGSRGGEMRPMQLMFESVPGYPFGDSRWIILDDADDDAAYDSVIPTPKFTGALL
jgi:hypothetical protein